MKKSFSKLIALLCLSTLLMSCNETRPTTPGSTNNTGNSSNTGSDSKKDFDDKSALNVNLHVRYNGVEDKTGTYGLASIESRDNVTGAVTILVKAKKGYGLLNVIARDSQKKRIETTKGSIFQLTEKVSNTRVTYDATRINLTLTDSDINVNLYMGDDASDNLSDENWQLIADLGDSPIISADVTSPDLNAYFGASLNFSPYGYYGKRNGDEKEPNYVSAHCYYNSNDYEAFSFVKDETGHMAYTYLGADNKQGYQVLTSNGGNPMAWDSTFLGNGGSVNFYTKNPFEFAYTPLTKSEYESHSLTKIDYLKRRFNAVNVGDGTVKLTTKSDNGYDFGEYFILVLAYFYNSVYSGNLDIDSANDFSLEIILDPTNKVINSVKGQFTAPFKISGQNKTFTYYVELTAWNDAPVSEGLPGSWNSQNDAITSYYTSIHKDDGTKNSVFAYPNVTAMTSEDMTADKVDGAYPEVSAADQISERDLVKKIQEGNYSLDVDSRMVMADGYPSGVGTADQSFAGTAKVVLNDGASYKGVHSTLPAVKETLKDENQNDYDVVLYDDVYAFGNKFGTEDKLAVYGAYAGAYTSLSSKGLTEADFNKGSGFGFDRQFLNLKSKDANSYTYYRNFKEANNYSYAQSTNVFSQVTNPLDFAFGSCPNSADTTLSALYGYVSGRSQLKDITINVGTDEVVVTINGWSRAYGSNLNYTATFRYYNIGTTTLSSDEQSSIDAIKASIAK